MEILHSGYLSVTYFAQGSGENPVRTGERHLLPLLILTTGKGGKDAN